LKKEKISCNDEVKYCVLNERTSKYEEEPNAVGRLDGGRSVRVIVSMNEEGSNLRQMTLKKKKN